MLVWRTELGRGVFFGGKLNKPCGYWFCQKWLLIISKRPKKSSEWCYFILTPPTDHGNILRRSPPLHLLAVAQVVVEMASLSVDEPEDFLCVCSRGLPWSRSDHWRSPYNQVDHSQGDTEPGSQLLHLLLGVPAAVKHQLTFIELVLGAHAVPSALLGTWPHILLPSSRMRNDLLLFLLLFHFIFSFSSTSSFSSVSSFLSK